MGKLTRTRKLFDTFTALDGSQLAAALGIERDYAQSLLHHLVKTKRLYRVRRRAFYRPRVRVEYRRRD
ncbi:hypothetical protein [Deinococcus sp. S9]|uniref:hypothetical protein n=1 Tax=Deinococcus sp. S9 TaxID=2545754 RepID=UPI0010543C85|nr:hypothetical protein [Deinococcus sp. S9]TDE87418.1 hypothetical protein E0686_02690 [Deinococcus sp. S9]